MEYKAQENPRLTTERLLDLVLQFSWTLKSEAQLQTNLLLCNLHTFSMEIKREKKALKKKLHFFLQRDLSKYLYTKNILLLDQSIRCGSKNKKKKKEKKKQMEFFDFCSVGFCAVYQNKQQIQQFYY